jgi:hypothetical protein
MWRGSEQSIHQCKPALWQPHLCDSSVCQRGRHDLGHPLVRLALQYGTRYDSLVRLGTLYAIGRLACVLAIQQTRHRSKASNSNGS